jgi:hypothetical protein
MSDRKFGMHFIGVDQDRIVGLRFNWNERGEARGSASARWLSVLKGQYITCFSAKCVDAFR